MKLNRNRDILILTTNVSLLLYIDYYASNAVHCIRWTMKHVNKFMITTLIQSFKKMIIQYLQNFGSPYLFFKFWAPAHLIFEIEDDNRIAVGSVRFIIGNSARVWNPHNIFFFSFHFKILGVQSWHAYKQKCWNFNLYARV